MGMKLFSPGNKLVPNPDPKNYTIKRTEEHGPYIVALINYPDATPYGGDKVLVFHCGRDHLYRMTEIDPHFTGTNNFTDTNKRDPIARFPGADFGWNLAVKLAKVLCI